MTDSTLLFEVENMIATLRAQLAAVQRELMKVQKLAKALSIEDAIGHAETGESEIQDRLRWFEVIASLRAELAALRASPGSEEADAAENAYWNQRGISPKPPSGAGEPGSAQVAADAFLRLPPDPPVPDVTAALLAANRAQLHAAITRVIDYRQHVIGCDITHTDFCSCGLREAIDNLDAKWKLVAHTEAIPASVQPETGHSWRSMASAPKDGTRVLVATERAVVVAYQENRLISVEPDQYAPFWFADDDDRCTPTLWMPLPPLPDPPSAQETP